MSKYIWKRMWARKFAPFISSSFMRVLQKHHGLDLSRNKLFVPEGGLYAIYFEEGELNRTIENYTNFLKGQDMTKYAVLYESQFNDFLEWSKKATNRDFTKLSNNELSDIVKMLSDKLVDFAEIQFYAFLVLGGAGKEVETKLSDKPSIMQHISTPYKHIQIMQARIDLLNLVAIGQVSEDSLNKYLKKYSWITIYDFTDKPMSMESLKEQLKTIKDAKEELKNIEHHKEIGLKEYKEYFKTIKDKEFKKTVEIVHYFSYLKEMRDDYRRQAYFLWIPFWHELAKRIGLSLEEANCLLKDELVEALTLKKDFSKITSERNKKFALWYKEGKLQVFSGKEADKIAEMVKEEVVGSEIKGSVASKGKATGKVSIIYHQEEFGKFREGDVLVTTMTHPEFLVLMKKASAVITDEGGITCHAAIVSRELGMPCIIGTKVATKVLQDGDLVEVDGDKGIVRIIKKHG